MPLYDYQCRACAKVTEVRHGFREVYDGTCPTCGGDLARVFNAAGIVFKGSGFYVTDSRKKPSAEPSTPSTAGTTETAAKQSESTPAAKSSESASPKSSESAA